MFNLLFTSPRVLFFKKTIEIIFNDLHLKYKAKKHKGADKNVAVLMVKMKGKGTEKARNRCVIHAYRS